MWDLTGAISPHDDPSLPYLAKSGSDFSLLSTSFFLNLSDCNIPGRLREGLVGTPSITH